MSRPDQEAGDVPGECPAKRLCVLKFGSSVLEREEDYPKVVQEIYRHVRDGEKVVAVVSALAGETDALLAQANRVGGDVAPDALVARLARVGELQSAALMALALSKAGLRAWTLDPHEMALVAEGSPLDSNLAGVDAEAVWARIHANDVVVVPGFIADHADHGVVTLGRGGTDLSAVFFAEQLSAHRVRLIKDVDGVYDEDPARNASAERFSQMSYAEAQEASSGLIQAKAIHAADDKDVLIEVAALGSLEATTIARVPAAKSRPPKPERLKVALLGCGSVGGGVLQLLLSQPELFHVGPVLVRKPPKHNDNVVFTQSLDEALAGDPDILVELVGGTELAAEAIHSALSHGAQVVTANKAALAKHWDSLHAAASRHGGSLRFSAAVGGGAPIIETLRRLDGNVVSVEGVMNGTCNYLLSRLAEGWNFDDALAKAQELGFAEADPTADVDGHDAADKLAVLAREAFGVPLQPRLIAKHSLRDLVPEAALEALQFGEVLKQVGVCRLLPDGSVEAEVQVVALPASHPLAGARDEENRFLVTDAEGNVHEVFGKGAGRWPTATAVFADVMDAQRALLGRQPVARDKAVKLRA
ncbi:homoserine dehydrogenase [Sphingomonas sp. SM33]|uniref:Homoserine dehydrogenase n=1 Tax=Sphingomonas telluris TaxID=2907998 RepID=A0ABS9VM89_9SPHN|nr:homoserine dehydrogenase [Sphingomonas telluris]MCH8616073.1 homoserine dehydrogenase [Sphingomonas telluris]